MATDSNLKAVTTKTKTSAGKSKPAKGPELRLKQAQRAAMLLKHVSDPTRLQVVLMLDEGEATRWHLCRINSRPGSQPAVSHHLALLRHGGIISPRRQGKNNFYGLTETGAGLAKVVKGLLA